MFVVRILRRVTTIDEHIWRERKFKVALAGKPPGIISLQKGKRNDTD